MDEFAKSLIRGGRTTVVQMKTEDSVLYSSASHHIEDESKAGNIQDCVNQIEFNPPP